MNRIIIGLILALCVVVGAGLFGILDSRATDVFFEATRPDLSEDSHWCLRLSERRRPGMVGRAYRRGPEGRFAAIAGLFAGGLAGDRGQGA